MKKLILLLAVIYPLSLFSQNLLDTNWKFKTGDSPEWSGLSYNDSNWSPIEAGTVWEFQGYNTYDGFAWYRKTVVIPASLKKEGEKNGGLLLDIGMLDDAGVIFWNGKKVLANGQFPPSYKTAYSEPARVEIPAKEVNWGGKNLIAVKVYDEKGNGGIYGGKVSLRVKGLTDLFHIETRMPVEDHIFTHVKSVVIPVVYANDYPGKLEGTVEYRVTNDFHDSIMTKTINLTLKKKKSFTDNLILEDLAPGFYEVNVLFKSDVENTKYTFRFGKDPEEIVSPLDRPADFDDYWRRAKKELAAVEPQFKMIYEDSMSTPERAVYLVEMRSLGNVLIRGWYGKPRKEGVYPAILHVQGYSSNQTLDWAYPGNDMAVFALNIRGHGNSRDDVNPGFPGYLQDHLNDAECYIYRGAYMDCLRAVDFLFSRPEVDTTRVVVEGGSQGGALSFATAALDNKRIALCVPHVPFLSDFRDYFKVAVWPANEFFAYKDAHPEISWDEIYHTLSYIDIKNLAPWIKAPVYMGAGLMDVTCPPHINFAAYNQLKVPKEYVIFPWSGHGINPKWHVMKYVWIKKHLGME